MKAPRILIYDIETTPILGYVWSMYEANVLGDPVEPSHQLCYSYRWYGEEEVHVVSQRQFGRSWRRNMRDDRQLITSLWKLFNEADIIVAHNGDQFDQKKSQARMLVHGLSKPSPYFQVDTLKIARKNFKLESNRLDAVGKVLGCGQKLSTGGFGLWTGCMSGDEDAWDTMEAYNVQDVQLLTEVYETLLMGGWIDNHPSLSNISGRPEACPKCGQEGRMQKRGIRYTKTTTYQQYQCGHCSSYSRERTGKGPRFV